jgi:hypothetical protein
VNGDAVLEVLKEIRDEAKQTNARLDQTNTRLESLEGRVDFLERRASKWFAELANKQSEVEMRLATEIVSLTAVTREVRDLLERKLDDHEMVIGHEHRLKTLEERNR